MLTQTNEGAESTGYLLFLPVRKKLVNITGGADLSTREVLFSYPCAVKLFLVCLPEVEQEFLAR